MPGRKGCGPAVHHRGQLGGFGRNLEEFPKERAIVTQQRGPGSPQTGVPWVEGGGEAGGGA